MKTTLIFLALFLCLTNAVWVHDQRHHKLSLRHLLKHGHPQPLSMLQEKRTRQDPPPPLAPQCTATDGYVADPTHLNIISAVYGRGDVTGIVRNAVTAQNGYSLNIDSSNGVFTDTWPGWKKTLVVVYQYGECAPQLSITEEGETLTLGAYSGQVDLSNCPATGGQTGGSDDQTGGPGGESTEPPVETGGSDDQTGGPGGESTEPPVETGEPGGSDGGQTGETGGSDDGQTGEPGGSDGGETGEPGQGGQTGEPEGTDGSDLTDGTFIDGKCKCSVDSESDDDCIPLIILGAAFGPQDVTDKVQAIVQQQNGHSLDITPYRDGFSDPWVNVLKDFVVVYKYGRSGAPQIVFTLDGVALSIPKATAQQAKDLGRFKLNPGLNILGATYGNGDRTEQFRDIVQQQGGNKLSVTAENSVFGDTLYGWLKSSVVVYQYSNGSVQTEIVREHDTITISQ